MEKRLKEIRKHFGETQKTFGETLGVSRDVYANIENARVEPNKTFVQLLCSTYNVNETWLRTGKGEMFSKTKKTVIDSLCDEYKMGYYGKKVLETYLDLDEKQQSIIENMLKEFVHNCMNDSESNSNDVEFNEEIAPVYDNGVDIEKELEEYRLELEAEKRGQISSVLPDAKNKKNA